MSRLIDDHKGCFSKYAVMIAPFIQSCLHDTTLLEPALAIVNDKLILLWTHNSRSDCAATWGKYMSLFVFYTVKCHWSNCLALLSTITTWSSLTWTNIVLSFKFLCNFLPPTSFYSFTVTFTYLSVRHTPCLTLPGLVVFKISLCFTWNKFPRSLWYALFCPFLLSASFCYIFSVLQSPVTAQTTRQCTLTTAKMVPSAPSTPSSPTQTSSSSSSSSPASSCPTLRPVR